MTNIRRLLLIALPLIVSTSLAACSSEAISEASRSPGEREDDMALGNANAPVVVIEYASLTCPHCAAFHKDVFPALKADYIDTGKVRFVFRQLPTPPAPLAVGGEAVARCAGPDKYFDLLDILYERQGYWVTSTNPRQALMEIAATVGITETQFDACVSDEGNITRIQEVVKAAQDQYGSFGTPSLVINGQLLPPAYGRPYNIGDLSAVIDPALATTP